MFIFVDMFATSEIFTAHPFSSRENHPFPGAILQWHQTPTEDFLRGL